MQFGLENAPGTFQHALRVILATVHNLVGLEYLDDISIFSKSLEDHIKYEKHILTLLGDAGITIKLKKF